MIFTILTHCLNSADANSYFGRAECRRFFLDTTAKGLVPIAPLDAFQGGEVGPRRRLSNGRDPTSFYLTLSALALAQLQCSKMPCGAAECSENFRRSNI